MTALVPYIKLIQRSGPLTFAKIMSERSLDRVTGGAVSRYFFNRAMRSGRVYFGEHLGARQGVAARHAYMFRLACQEVGRGSDPFQVVEVGSYAGGSAITWGLAVKTMPARRSTVICIDPWSNYFTEEDIRSSATPEVLRAMADALADGKVFKLFQHNVAAAGVADVIRPIRGRFAEVAATLPEASSDIVFVDGDHQYSAVTVDLRRGAALVRAGGILCGDDLEEQWPALDQAYCARHADADWIVDPRTRQFVHAGVAKALWEFFGQRVSAWKGFWAMRKAERGTWEPVTIDGVSHRQDLPPHFRWWAARPRA